MNPPGEEAAVILPGLHHHGEVGQLGGPVVDVQAVEVVFQDALGGVPLAPPLALVHLHQHIEGVDQDVPAAHAEVDEFQVGQRRSVCLQSTQLGADGGILLRFR